MSRRRKPALIPEWRSAIRRFASMKFAAFGTAAAAAWLMVPEAQQLQLLEFIGVKAPNVVALLTFVSIMVGRVLYLKPRDDSAPVETEHTTTGGDLDSAVKEEPPPP